MKSIKFVKNAKEYSLNMDGTVKADGTAFGTWSTDTANNLEIAPAAGSTAAKLQHPATWRTDEANRLLVKPEGGVELDFLEATEQAVALVITQDVNQLTVTPRVDDNGFKFRLNGEWNLSADYEKLELNFGTGPATVKFTGGVADQSSRFTWRFYSDDRAFDLTFKGAWSLEKVQDPASKRHVVAVFKFTYATGAGNKNDQFTIPMVMSVSPNQNRLVLSYDKSASGKGSGAVEFAGRFNTKNGSIGSYTFEYRNENGQPVVGGTFKLKGALKKGGAATANSLEVSFKFENRTVDLTLKGSFGSKSNSNWDFEFKLHHSATTPGDSTLSLKLTRKVTDDGGRLFIEIKVGAGTTTISIEYNSATQKIQIDFELEIKNGRIASADLLFGIKF